MITIEFVCGTILFVLFVCLALVGLSETIEILKNERKGKK
jgi:hypothetical protein